MTAAELVARWRTQVGKGQYWLGAGGWDPKRPETCFHQHWDHDKFPNTIGCDCSAFAIKFGLKLAGSRKGFGRGPGARVTDAINSDSALYDAIHNHEIFVHVAEGPPIAGDYLVTPSTFDKETGKRIKVGHVRGVTGNRALEWDHAVLPRPWHLVDVIECRGPNGEKPGVIEGTAAACARHDAKWLRVPEMQTQIIRVRDDFLAAIAP